MYFDKILIMINKSNVTKYLFKVLPYIIFIVQLYILDFCVRSIDLTETTYSLFDVLPNAFTLSFAFLFVGIILAIPYKLKKITYIILIVILTLISLIHMIYYLQVNFAFTFQMFDGASNGSPYYLESFLRFCSIRPVHLIAILFVIVFSIINLFLFKKNQTHLNLKAFCVCIIVAIILNCLCLSIATTNSIFNKFEERYLCLKIGGFYEYILRDITTPAVKIDENISEEDKQFLDSQFKVEINAQNEYTGIFKNKNVIFLQLEGVDSWLLTQEDTPNLYKLKQNSIDFQNHYTMLSGAGSTINNEMAANTGYYMPLCAAISDSDFYIGNNFKITLPQSFKSINYKCNMFHMNKGEFYNRQKIAKHLGYDNYYGLKDICSESPELELDRQLIDNSEFYKNIFQQTQPFMNYIITYTPHLPYSYTGKGKILADEKGINNPNQLSETDYLKLDVQETDNMVGKLMQALKDNNLYDNTVIVAYADHCQYGMIDQPEIQEKCSGIPDLTNQTPFFIWSKNIDPKKIDKTSMQVDIMPTVLNLFGINYNKSQIIGHDILDSKHPNIAIFKNRSYLKGKKYYKNDSPSNDYIDTLIKKNDLVITKNYLKNLLPS